MGPFSPNAKRQHVVSGQNNHGRIVVRDGATNNDQIDNNTSTTNLLCRFASRGFEHADLPRATGARDPINNDRYATCSWSRETRPERCSNCGSESLHRCSWALRNKSRHLFRVGICTCVKEKDLDRHTFWYRRYTRESRWFAPSQDSTRGRRSHWICPRSIPRYA